MPIHLNQYSALEGKGSELESVLSEFVDLIKSSEGCSKCQLLIGTDSADLVSIKSEWDSIESHKASVHNIPPDLQRKAMLLLADRPKGVYYEREGKEYPAWNPEEEGEEG